MKDPYQILGISKDASDAEIKKAYRKLAKEYHPDRGGDESRFKDIAEAYDVLTDPKKKAKLNSNPFGNFDESFFEDFIRNGGPGFSGMFNQRYGFSGKGGDVTAQVYITLEEAYLGGRREIRVGQKVISVDIKPGTKPGQKMRLKGLGQRGLTEEQNGDLILEVLVQDDPNFYLDQKGLHTIKRVNLYEALLGGKGEVQVFDKTISYTIPKCVRNGTMLRIKGKGFPNYHNPSICGDFFVNILVDLPTQLTEEQEELVKKMKDLNDGI